MNRSEAIFPGVLLLAVAALVAGGIFIAGYSWKVIAFPFGAALVMGGLCLVVVTTALTSRTAGAAAETSAQSRELPAEPLTPASLAWLFALALFLYGLGFVFGPAAYLLVYLRAHRAVVADVPCRRGGFAPGHLGALH